MPVNITAVDAFTDPVQAPDDGDAANGTTFQLAPQALANRTLNLHNRVTALEGPERHIIPGYQWTPVGTASHPGIGVPPCWVMDTNSTYLRHSLELRQGATLESIDLLVSQGNAGPTGVMSVNVYRTAISDSGAGTTIELATLDFAEGTGYQHEELAISADNVVDNELYQYTVIVHASAAAASNNDIFQWCAVTQS